MRPPLENIIESILFVSEQPMKLEELMEVLGKIQEQQADSKAIELSEVNETLAILLEKYKHDIYPFEIRKIANGYQFLTKSIYYPYVRQASIIKNQKRLSKAALEVLSIVAYKQPLSKAEIEHIRGVNSDYAVQKLLDKKLIVISGRSDAPGRPLLYATGEYFLQYLGINSLTDLPKLKEFEITAEEEAALFKVESTPK
ncbi:MAG: SMC-Scp complex subunit ScpB [Bacteroidia bacterium]